MPERDLQLLNEAAQEAGEIACRFWRGALRQWEKDDGAGPVTDADLAVNDHLHSRLLGARPDYGWLSEESPDSPDRLQAKRCFIIDPIDGTRAFIAGQEGFSQALAVVEDGDVVAGVVHLPALGLTYAAHRNGPATLNGVEIHPSAVRLPDAKVLTGKASLAPELWRKDSVPEIKRSFRPSLAWRLCLVAEGRFDAALSMRPAWEWDIAAGSLIAARAGAVVSDMRGQAMRFNSASAQMDGLIIAGPALHAEFMQRIRPKPEL